MHGDPTVAIWTCVTRESISYLRAPGWVFFIQTGSKYHIMASLFTFPTNAYRTTAAASLAGSRNEISSQRALRQGGPSLPFAAPVGVRVGSFDPADVNPDSVRKFVNQIRTPLVRNIPLHARTTGRSGRILMTVVHAMGVAPEAKRGSV